MNNTYIPNILKEKLSLSLNYFYGLIYLSIFIFLLISLFSFDINDNSFLTKSSQSVNNLGGEIGSHLSSFIFYTFGMVGYAFIIFFFTISFLTFLKRRPKHFFIRLFILFISLILIPQTFVHINLDVSFVKQIEDWGVLSKSLYLIHQINYISYSLSVIGLILFFFSLNIHQFFKVPSFNSKNFLKLKKNCLQPLKIKKNQLFQECQ